ncbi:MAG: hypothetical protein JNM80_11020 [Phycisphaerae bacterium]|nr:hypothetical protein [Phycisphaerae bacterium]
MNVPAWTKPAGVAAVVLLAAYSGYSSLYASPRDRLRGQIEKARGEIAAYDAALKARPAVRAELKQLAAATLPGTVDEADALLRTALNTIADESGLATIRVDTNRPEDIANPVGSSKLATPMRAQIRKQRDFAVIRSTLTGVGTFDQCLRCVASLQAQPWIHRRESVSLIPADKDRTRFTLRVALASIYLSGDAAPKPTERLAIVPASPAALAEAAALAQKSLFRVPPPTAVAKADPPQPASGPKPPPPPPYHEWRLTGVVQSPRLGVEAWVVNTRTQQRLSLGVGSAIESATFVAGAGERAVFEIDGSKYEVFNGQTLAQRRPCER